MSAFAAAETVTKSWLEGSFEKAIAKVPALDYNAEWKQGDYFNGACQVELKPGEIVSSVCPAPQNRRMLLIGTRAGTVVVFERYTPNINQPFVLVSNAPVELRWILPSGSINEVDLSRIVDVHNPVVNTGSNMEKVFNMKTPSQRIS